MPLITPMMPWGPVPTPDPAQVRHDLLVMATSTTAESRRTAAKEHANIVANVDVKLAVLFRDLEDAYRALYTYSRECLDREG